MTLEKALRKSTIIEEVINKGENVERRKCNIAQRRLECLKPLVISFLARAQYIRLLKWRSLAVSRRYSFN